MAQQTHLPVMDICPWPSGQGFSGADAWWQDVLRQDEQQRLDYLIGVAVLSEEIGRRLLQRDEELLNAFRLSEETVAWLRDLPEDSIQDIASAIAHRNDVS